MITKIMKGNGFKGVASYITRNDANARVIGADNLPSADSRQAARIMRQTANQSTRCKKPVLHFAMRPAPGDRILTDEEFLKAGRKMLKAFGMEGHQAVFVLHDAGTPEQHLHVLANRIDPATSKAAALSNDRRIAKQVAAQIEKDFGLQVAVQERPREKAGKDTDKERRERRRKGRTGTDRHKEAAKAALARSGASTSDFQAILNEQGFALAQGDRRGVVIVDRSGRACSFSRALTKEQRYQLGIDRAGLPAVPAARRELAQLAQNRKKSAAKSLPQLAPVHRLQKENNEHLRLQKENNLKKRRQTSRINQRRVRGFMRTVYILSREIDVD